MLKALCNFCSEMNRITERLLAILGLSMALLVAAQVFFRYVLNHSLFWSEELSRYMLVWLTFLGATVAYYRGLHPGVDVLTSRLPQRGKRLTQHVVSLISTALFGTMIVSGTQFAWFVRMQVSPALDLPKWIVMMIIPASGAILLLYVLMFTLKTLKSEDSHDS